jgi:predicted nucleic acid-binding Zn ribbon protein
MYRTYDYHCHTCGYHSIELHKKDDHPSEMDCPSCEALMVLGLAAPAVFRNAYHDGYKRGGDYQVLKEATKLEKQMVNLPHEKRGELRKQIRKLKAAAKTEKSKTQ